MHWELGGDVISLVTLTRLPVQSHVSCLCLIMRSQETPAFIFTRDEKAAARWQTISHSAKYSRIRMFSPFITPYTSPHPPTHPIYSSIWGNQEDELITRAPDFLTMLGHKSSEIKENTQNQRLCWISFPWERNCERFYIFTWLIGIKFCNMNPSSVKMGHFHKRL